MNKKYNDNDKKNYLKKKMLKNNPRSSLSRLAYQICDVVIILK